ncbi:hypothetical protein MHBO_000888 [Bonamia ostreae]|uniref:PUM-HD domain-containing protein n=1 Tax=Bonamia ostreae TaxID=126728 RepID=A0ABV2AH51_9EUKA
MAFGNQWRPSCHFAVAKIDDLIDNPKMSSNSKEILNLNNNALMAATLGFEPNHKWSEVSKNQLNSDILQNEFCDVIGQMNEINLNDNSNQNSIKEQQHRLISFCFSKKESLMLQNYIKNGKADRIHDAFKSSPKEICRVSKNVFGNYVIQLLLQFGTDQQKDHISDKISDNCKDLAFNKYGSRVVETAIKHATDRNAKKFIKNLQDKFVQCSIDINGTHIVQSLIEKDAEIANNVLNDEEVIFLLSKDTNGSRVVQKMILYFRGAKQNDLLEKIMSKIKVLVLDRNGNYVVQTMLRLRHPNIFSRICDLVTKDIRKYSCHKYARSRLHFYKKLFNNSNFVNFKALAKS